MAIIHADKNLQLDREIALQAFLQDNKSFFLLDNLLYDDKKFMTNVIQIKGEYFKYASPKL